MVAQAQISGKISIDDDDFLSPLRGSSKRSPMGAPEEEMRARNQIKIEEKERSDNLSRVRDGALIADALHRQFVQNPQFGREEIKKLERLEKLIRKVRSEAGGGDSQSIIENAPETLDESLKSLAETAGALRREVEDTPRQVISASIITRASAALLMIKNIRQKIALP